MDQDNHITTLMGMGFENVEDIKRALRLSKSDINEAVAILTNEPSDFSLLNEDVEMKNEDASGINALVSTVAPPPYDMKDYDLADLQVTNSSQDEDTDSVEFPTTNLYELETRVYTDKWSIPYKREESLGKCMLSATYFAEKEMCEVEENCKRFIENCLPEAFKKLLQSPAVRGWVLEVHEGVRCMVYMLIDLVTARLKYDPVSIPLLQVLEMVFDPESEFNSRNKTRPNSSSQLLDVLSGHGHPYAMSKDNVESYGWLVDLINKFGHQSGFQEIQNRFTGDYPLNGMHMAALLTPIAKCAEFLVPSKVCLLLSPCMDIAVKYIKLLSDNDIKSKNICAISDLLKAMKLLCVYLWPHQLHLTNKLYLEVILRMLKCPHFNARMNGLKEVTKLIDDCLSISMRSSRTAIDSEELLNWLVENEVLSIGLEGNIDQMQYMDKIKGIIEFIGHRLSLEELTKVWNIQNGQNAQIVDNIHTIMIAASSKFNTEQLDHLLALLQTTWQNSTDQLKKRLIGLMGRIGKESSICKSSTKMLDAMWDFSHSPSLPLYLVELAFEEHFSILSVISAKDHIKKHYCVKCIDNIKKGVLVLPSLKLLHNMSENMLKLGIYKQERTSMGDLNKTHEVIKMITGSLAASHRLAVAAVGDGQLSLEVLVDGRYTHEDYLVGHLNFLQFFLQDGSQYLPWHRAKEIWDCLVSNPDACENDKEICFEWFTRCLQDLETDTQAMLFQQKLLRLDPAQLTTRGFQCFKTYFESVNISEGKLRRSLSSLVVEKLDLNGVDFLWQVALSSEEGIADACINYLLEIYHHSLTHKLKLDAVSLHKRFINECYKRLESVGAAVGGTAMFTAVSNATKTLTAISVSEVASRPTPTKATRLQNICRLLQITERYISSIEESHSAPRTILSHGQYFLGHPILIRIVMESNKDEFFVVSHSNESLGLVKQRIAQHVHQPFSQISLNLEDYDLSREKNQRLIGQIPNIDKQAVTVKCPYGPVFSEERDTSYTFSGASTMSSNLWSANHGYGQEQQEKQLPGVVMAAGGQVFEMLYNMAGLDDPKITAQVRTLLHLIPTNPATLDALDSISAKKVIEITPSEGTKGSPRFSPKKFTVNSPTRDKMEPGPKDTLKNLFDINTPISPFKLLYNLEVLSGKLMPVLQDAGTLQSAKIFCKDFLSVGGLRLILNIVQKDSICNEVDYTIRQCCYSTALTIARFLLCNQTELEIENVTSVHLTLGSLKKTIIEFPSHSSPSFDISPDVAVNCNNKAIHGMKQTELLDVLLSLMRIAWAAAAGNLHLANCCLPNKEGHFYGGRRSRQSSSGSTSSGSDGGESTLLHGGVCGQQRTISLLDSLLSQKALKFIVHCLQMRPDIFGLFIKLPCIRDFVIDILLGSSCHEVRACALEQFFKLSHLKVTVMPSPKHHMLELLLKAHLPLWVNSSCIRGANQRLLDQCKEYFELCCGLLDGLKVSEQFELQINARQMVGDELTWLQAFSPSSSAFLKSADSALMAGHFKFVKTLLRCEGVHKEDVGKLLIPDLLENFLFPASYLISLGTASNDLSSSVTPKCTTQESCVAAYDLLVELATGCVGNVEKLVKQLLSMHHHAKPELAKEFEYEPLVAGRSTCGYVGLKNAGATCYMNSVIQQLYMQPGIKEFILSIDENDPEEDSLFYQFQMVFAHLLESRLEYHIPENFWRCFRLWGEPINVREQQDAFEFFTHLIDQIDEYLIKIKVDPVFKQNYEGLFSDQKICQGCPHWYEREESFIALNLPVKSHNLQDSLDQFVKGELLEGSNAYFCEKCHEKRNAIKRTCIKTLPTVLVIQLKRFDYDWEANRSMKFDDYFRFPWYLDMKPYTIDGMLEKDHWKDNELMDDNQVVPSTATVNKNSSTAYELVGVIVHSGQANAGHYYSYIKERRRDKSQDVCKWLKFNDTTVEEFAMNDGSLEAECFGGTYKAQVRDTSSSYPENRQRYWNAYLLFYEKIDETVRTPRTPRKTPNKFSFRKSENDVASAVSRNLFKPTQSNQNSPHRQRDSLSQLTQLVDRGERHGLFIDKMPVRIEQVVREENLGFMHNCDIYNDSYFTFVLRLAKANMSSPEPEFSQFAMNSILPLSLNFLFNTYLRYKNRINAIITDWVHLIENTIVQSKEASVWFIDFFGSDVGLSYLKPYLLECPNRDVRQVFARLLEKGISSFFSHGGEVGSQSLDRIIVHLLDMLNQDVPDNCRSCSQYFGLLCTYAQLGTKTCAHLSTHKAFQKFLVFLLGPAASDMQNTEIYPRRWNSVQTQDFVSLHAAMAFLVLNCSLAPHRTCAPDSNKILESVWASNTTMNPMPNEIVQSLYGPGAHRYIHEVVSACREIGGSISLFVDMLIQCSYCCEQFSTNVINQILLQYSSVPSNELKNLSYLLLELLHIDDPLQFMRVRLAIDGCCCENNFTFDGILSIIRANQAHDGRRSYQGVKFLVSLAHKTQVAKDYLMKTPNKWQWSVNWLKKMMTERNYLSIGSNSHLSNEDSNTKNFQRTTSAQDTLDEATALLTEVDSPESPDVAMDICDMDDNVPLTESLFESEDKATIKRADAVMKLDSID